MSILVCALVSYNLGIAGEKFTLPAEQALRYGVDENTPVRIEVPESSWGLDFFDHKQLNNGSAFITVWREKPVSGNPAPGRLFVLRNDGSSKTITEAQSLVNKSGEIFSLNILRVCEDL